jgi:Zn-dependent metalloprotease
MRKLIAVLIAFYSYGAIQAKSIELYGKRANDKVSGAEVVRFKDFSTIPNYVKFRKGKELPFDKLNSWLNNFYPLDYNYGLDLINVETDNLGFTHYRYRQTINNIPVSLSMFIVHTQNGLIKSMNGELFDKEINTLTNSINEESALSSALVFVGAETYKWEIEKEEKHLKWASDNNAATYYPRADLVFISKDGEISNELKLAYRFNIYAHQPMSRQEVYIDAINGEVLWSENKIHHVDEVGTAVTGYSGTQTMTSDNTGGGVYRLQETGRGNGVRTFNCNEGTSYGAATDFTNNSATWNLGGVNKFATDAHWGAEMTYDYYLNEHGRNSIDNNGFRLDSYVHYDQNYGNAFWDGQRMTYGDGSSGNAPFTALDIAGHEITHGLTTFTADLVYQGESGALNESFSDIFGVSVEYIARPAQANWVMGEDLGGTGIRNMANPNSKGDPDTYFGTNWADLGGGDNGGVHTNSGVQNFWYVLLVDGGSGTNDNGDTYSVNALGLDLAADIAFRNLTVYLTTNSNYADARFFSIQSTIDLFGGCTPQVESVTNAWYAVGVGAQYQPFTASDFEACLVESCTVPFTVDFTNNSVNGNTFDWDFGDGGTSVALSPSHTYNAYGSYTVELFVDGGATCGNDTEIKTAYINIDSNLACTTVMAVSGSSTITECSGTLFDSGGPCSLYGANQASQVTIAPTGAGQVNLTINLFDVEAGDQGGTICNYDNLKIYDGPTTSSPLIGTFCNNNLPAATISSSGSAITIAFLSDGGLEESGFEIEWSCDVATAAPTVDFIVDADTTCTGEVNFTDLSSNGPTDWQWDFGDGTNSTAQNPTHIYTSPGLYTVQLTATNLIGSGIETKSNYIYINMPDAPVVQGDSICEGNPANLTATGTGLLNWYDSPSSTTVLTTGNSYNTPILNAPTTYYVEDVIEAQLESLGKLDNSGGGNYLDNEQYLVFDVYQEMFIQTVQVYAQSSGSRTVQLKDKFGTVIGSKTQSVSAGLKTFYLLFTVPPGTDYQLVLSGGSTTKDLYRNNAGVNYPYSINGLGSIKNSSAGLSYYYYFYDWQVKGPDCTSPRTPVLADVNLCTGIVDLSSNSSGITSYFNSFSNNLEMNLKDLEKGTYDLSVYNTVGQVVYQEQLNVEESNVRKFISLASQANGIYFISLRNEEKSYSNKIVK